MLRFIKFKDRQIGTCNVPLYYSVSLKYFVLKLGQYGEKWCLSVEPSDKLRIELLEMLLDKLLISTRQV